MSRRTQRELTAPLRDVTKDKLLTVDEAAERLNTTARFPRRLIEERRITFVRIGRNVRIPESELEAFIVAGIVQPITKRQRRAA